MGRPKGSKNGIRLTVDRICQTCNKSFKVRPYLVKNGFGKCCSPDCLKKYFKIKFTGKGNPFYGKHHTEESKQKVSISKQGQTSWNKGKHWSKEIKKKFSIAHTGMKFTEEHKSHMGSKMEKNYFWKGGKTTHQGYILIKKNDHPFHNHLGYVQEHRLVMEKHLGRFLLRPEECHHVNHNREDNRIENLMLFNGISSHRRFEAGGIVKPEEIVFDGRKFSH